MKKSYKARDLSIVPPIEFELGGETYHVPRKARPDVVTMLAASITLDENGVRHYPEQTLRSALIVMVAEEVWDAEKKEWVRVDEGQRLAEFFRSPRWVLDPDVLGELVWDLVEEITAFPTGVPRPSSGGTGVAAEK